MLERLPVWVRAVVAGLLISAVPTVVWAVIATINLKLTPSVPWSMAIMAAVLGWDWHVVGSRARTGETISRRIWRLLLIGGASLIVAAAMLFAALRSWLNFEPPPSDPSQLPVWTLIAGILMTSAVAAMVEETGFRGYMQQPLERTYGPITAISITSVVFALIHLTHGTGILPLLPFILGAGALYGVLAHVTDSIVPSMTLHFVGDVVLLTMNSLRARGGATDGMAPSVYMAVALIAGALGVLACVLVLRHLRPAEAKRRTAFPWRA